MLEYSKKFKIQLAAFMLIIIIGGMAVSGCYGAITPSGWSGAAVDQDILFIGSGEGSLIAVDKTTGSQIDTIYLEPVDSDGDGSGCMAPVEPTIAIYGTPAVSGEFIYIGSYVKERNRTVGKLFAFGFDMSELKFQGDEPRWQYPQGDEYFDGPIVGGAVVALDKVYFGCSDGNIYALNAEDGYKEWQFKTGDKVWSTPVIKDETLYVGSFDNNLYALDANSGGEVWRYETGGGIATTPLLSDNTIYFGSFDRYVYAVDASDGSLIWQSEVEAGSWFWAMPLAYNGAIYAPNVDGKVYILAADDGKLMATVAPKSDQEGKQLSLIRSSPVLVGSSVIFATEEGIIYTLDTVDNSVAELYEVADEKIHAPLIADEDILYIHTQDGTLYAFDTEKKMKLWDYP